MSYKYKVGIDYVRNIKDAVKKAFIYKLLHEIEFNYHIGNDLIKPSPFCLIICYHFKGNFILPFL